jgi:glycosyltransferase involved in cell wall biosynthesis
MRHIWHDAEVTLGRLPRPLRPAGSRTIERLRRVDREAAGRVARWAVNSRTTARRAAAAYGLPQNELTVIPPPVTVPSEPPSAGPRAGLLVVSGMEPYKNDLLAVEAARRLGLPLTVVGDGPERLRLEAAAGGGAGSGAGARFLGYVADAELDRLYRSHAALLFCGEEDFGIVPVEAMARGCPVVALGRGGVTETVEPGVGGVFFAEPSVEAVVTAVESCLQRPWDPATMHAAAERFGPAAFRDAVRAWLG